MNSSTSTFTPFPAGYSKSVVAAPIFALFSTLALCFIALRTLILVAIPFFQGNAKASRAPENLFFRTQLGHYAAALVFSNVFISLSGLVEFRWVAESGITTGSLCDAQAVLMEIGNVSTAYFTVAMAIHTCNSLVLRIRQTSWLSPVVIAIGWITSFAFGLAPLKKQGLSTIYGPQGISCGVTSSHPALVFVFDALPILLGALFSVTLYSLIFLVLRGTLQIKGSIKFTLNPEERWSSVSNFEEYDRFIGAIARSLLWYPFAFITLLLPYSIASLAAVSGYNVPFGADVFAHVCCFLLGFANVVLLYNIFRVLNPVYHGEFSAGCKGELYGDKAFSRSSIYKGPSLPPVAVTFSGPGLPLYRKSDSSEKTSSRTELPLPALPAEQASRESVYSVTRMSVTEREIIRFSQISVEPPANRASFRESLPTESFQHLIAPLAELERQLSEPRDVPSRLSTITSSTALSALLDSQGITRSLTPAPRVVPTPEPSAHLLDTSEETVITPPITPTSEASATPSSTGLPRDSFGIRPLPVLPTATSGPPAFSGASGKRRAPPPVLRVIPAAPHIAEAEQSPLPVLSVSQRSSYSTSDTGISSSGSLRSIRPLPVLPRKASAEKVVQEPSRSNTMQSRRTTMTSVWSQDSAETHGHPVDVEAAISWSELSEGKRTSAGSSSTSSINQENRVRENAPARNGTFGAVPVPATLRPRTPLSNFTVRFTGANAAKRSSRGGSLLSGFSILPSPMAGKNSNAYASRSLPKGPSVSSRP